MHAIRNLSAVALIAVASLAISASTYAQVSSAAFLRWVDVDKNKDGVVDGAVLFAEEMGPGPSFTPLPGTIKLTGSWTSQGNGQWARPYQCASTVEATGLYGVYSNPWGIVSREYNTGDLGAAMTTPSGYPGDSDDASFVATSATTGTLIVAWPTGPGATEPTSRLTTYDQSPARLGAGGDAAPLRNQIITLNQTIITQNTTITTITTENTDLRTQNTNLTNENTSLRSSNTSLTAENTALKNERTQLNQLIADLRAGLNTSEQVVAQLRIDKTNLTAENTTLKGQLSAKDIELAAKIAELKKAQQDLVASGKIVKNRDATIAKLRGKLKASNKNVTKFKNLAAKRLRTIRKLRKQIRNSSSAVIATQGVEAAATILLDPSMDEVEKDYGTATEEGLEGEPTVTPADSRYWRSVEAADNALLLDALLSPDKPKASPKKNSAKEPLPAL